MRPNHASSKHPFFSIFPRIKVGRKSKRWAEEVYVFPQGKAVSETNLLINLNRILDSYDQALETEPTSMENVMATTPGKIYRLDRKDRNQEVQDACQIHDVSLRESFLRSCENLGIPPFAMTYFLDKMTSGDAELVVRNYGIGPTGAVAVTEALARNKSVKKLDLSLNNIQDKGAIAVSKLLEINTLINDVNLAENKISKDGTDALGKMLTFNDTLEHLNVSRNDLTDADIQLFSNVLQTEDTLRTLDLSHNSFRVTGGESIGEMVERNCSLKELDLGWNRFGDKGIKYISSGLKENRTLEKLHVCWNEIGQEGARYVAEALEYNGKLRELDLNNNHITDRGMERIAKGLELNDTLKVLKVGFNLITGEGACALLRSLIKNTGSALETVHMAEVVINSAIKELYFKLKTRRPNFELLEMSTPSGELFHFVRPQNPMVVLDNYLHRNNLTARRYRSVEEEE